MIAKMASDHPAGRGLRRSVQSEPGLPAAAFATEAATVSRLAGCQGAFAPVRVCRIAMLTPELRSTRWLSPAAQSPDTADRRPAGCSRPSCNTTALTSCSICSTSLARASVMYRSTQPARWPAARRALPPIAPAIRDTVVANGQASGQAGTDVDTVSPTPLGG